MILQPKRAINRILSSELGEEGVWAEAAEWLRTGWGQRVCVQTAAPLFFHWSLLTPIKGPDIAGLITAAGSHRLRLRCFVPFPRPLLKVSASGRTSHDAFMSLRLKSQLFPHKMGSLVHLLA